MGGRVQAGPTWALIEPPSFDLGRAATAWSLADLAPQGINARDDNPAGRLQLDVLMAVAKGKRSLIRERVDAGLRAAKGRCVRLGRPSTLVSRREEFLS